MYCIKCGCEIEDTDLFCIGCGNKIEKNESTKRVVKEKNIKKYILFSVVISFIGILFILFISNYAKETVDVNNNDYTQISKERIFTLVGAFWDDDGENKEILLDYEGNIIDVQPYRPYQEGGNIYSSSGDLSKVVGYDFEGQYIFKIEDGQKQKIYGSDAPYIDNLKISYTGGAAAYITDKNLYFVDLESDRADWLYSEVYSDELVLSPSGTTIMYIGDYNNRLDNNLYISTLKSDGTRTVRIIDRGIEHLVAVSDDAEAVFYIKNDGKLYFFDGRGIKCISENTVLANDQFNRVIVSEDCKDVIYLDGTNISRYRAGDKKKIDFGVENDYLTYYAPNDIAYSSAYSSRNELTTIILGKKNLEKIILNNNSDGLSFVEDEKLLKIVEGPIYEGYVANDFESVIYSKRQENDDWKLMQKELVLKSEEKELYHSEDWFAMDPSLDLSHIYIVAEKNIIYLNEGKMIKEWEANANYGVYSDLYNLYAYLSWEGELCYIAQNEIIKIAEAGHSYLYCPCNGKIWYEVKSMNEPIATWYILEEDMECKEIISYRELYEN